MKLFLLKNELIPVYLMLLITGLSYAENLQTRGLRFEENGQKERGLRYEDDVKWLLVNTVELLKCPIADIAIRDIPSTKDAKSHQIVIIKSDTIEILCTAVFSNRPEEKDVLFVDTIQLHPRYRDFELEDLLVKYIVKKVAPRLGYEYVVATATDEESKALLAKQGFQLEQSSSRKMIKQVTGNDDEKWLKTKVTELLNCNSSDLITRGLPLSSRGELQHVVVATKDLLPLCSTIFYTKPGKSETLYVENIFIHTSECKGAFADLMMTYIQRVASRLGYKTIEASVSDNGSLELLKRYGFISENGKPAHGKKQNSSKPLGKTIMIKDMTLLDY